MELLRENMLSQDYKGYYPETELKEAWNNPCITYYADGDNMTVLYISNRGEYYLDEKCFSLTSVLCTIPNAFNFFRCFLSVYQPTSSVI